MENYTPRFLLNFSFYIIFSLIVSLLMFEALIGILHQIDLKGHLKAPIRGYYLKFYRHINLTNRNIIQYLTNCARYDESLFYTLRPGVCNFKNEEFDTRVHVNTLGLRDDEESLKNPKIIFLGDSYTMGWGVNQEEPFPQIFENITKLKTLNAGISSYGTVRELKILKKIISAETQFIFIQYTGNDFLENKSFYTDGFLEISSKEKYYESIKKLEKKGYRFGEYAKMLIHLLWSKVTSKFKNLTDNINKVEASEVKAKYFINVLEKSGIGSRGPKIIVFSVEGYNKNNPGFIQDLSYLLEGTPLGDKVYPVDVSSILNQDDYFKIDAHINKEGHRKLARYLSNVYFDQVSLSSAVTPP